MFDESKLYRNDDPALDVIGRPFTRAHWRSDGLGPAFLRLGRHVYYRGSDLNAWLETRVVRPANGRTAEATGGEAA